MSFLTELHDPLKQALKRFAAVLVLVVAGYPAAQAQPQELTQMLKVKNCMACHYWDRKLLGPAFADIRARYTAADVPNLVSKVLIGGRGAWGPIPMPDNRSLSQAEAEFMVVGILGISGYVAPAAPAPLPDDPPSMGRVFKVPG